MKRRVLRPLIVPRAIPAGARVETQREPGHLREIVAAVRWIWAFRSPWV